MAQRESDWRLRDWRWPMSPLTYAYFSAAACCTVGEEEEKEKGIEWMKSARAT